MKWVIRFIIISFAVQMIFSCGNRKSPTGGEEDTENPEIVSVNPEAFSDISEGIIEITFSKPMDRQTVYAGERGLYLYPYINNKRYRWSDNTLRIEINEELQQDTNYYLTISRNITDLRNNRLDKEYFYIFHTGTLSENRIDGRIFYELEEDMSREVTINVLSADSLRIFSKEVRGERYQIDYLNDKDHIIQAFIDKNNNNRYDIGEEPFYQTNVPQASYAEVHLHLEYFDETEPEAKSAKSLFKNMIVVSLNKPVIGFEDINIVSADTLEHQPEVIGYDFIEDMVEIITSPMDTLKYKITLTNVRDNKDNVGEKLTAEFEASTKQDTTYLEISQYSPRDGAVVESLNPVLRVVFSKHVFEDDIDHKIIDTINDQEVSSFLRRVNSREFMIIPDDPLVNRRTYKLLIPKSTTDAFGNTLAGKFELNFLPIVTEN